MCIVEDSLLEYPHFIYCLIHVESQILFVVIIQFLINLVLLLWVNLFA